MVRVGCPITGKLVVRYPLLPLKLLKLTAGGVSVHLLVTVEVPPTAPVYGICLYECVTLCMCMCVSTGANLDGLKAKDKFFVYDWMHDNKSDLRSYNRLLLHHHTTMPNLDLDVLRHLHRL